MVITLGGLLIIGLIIYVLWYVMSGRAKWGRNGDIVTIIVVVLVLLYLFGGPTIRLR